MGNLGAYQAFTTKAATVGGVENLIKIIEKAAVAKQAPWLVVSGVAAGAVLTGLVKVTYDFGAAKYVEYKAAQTAAEDAKDSLRATLGEDVGSSAPPETPREDSI